MINRSSDTLSYKAVEIAQRLLTQQPPTGLVVADVREWFQRRRQQLVAVMAEAFGEVRATNQIPGINLEALFDHGGAEDWRDVGRAYAEDARKHWGYVGRSHVQIERDTLDDLDVEESLTPAERAELRAGIAAGIAAAPARHAAEMMGEDHQKGGLPKLGRQNFLSALNLYVAAQDPQQALEGFVLPPAGSDDETAALHAYHWAYEDAEDEARKPAAPKRAPGRGISREGTVAPKAAARKAKKPTVDEAPAGPPAGPSTAEDVAVAAAPLRRALAAILWSLPKPSDDRVHLQQVFCFDGKRLWSTNGHTAASYELDPAPGFAFQFPAAMARRMATDLDVKDGPSYVRIVRGDRRSQAFYEEPSGRRRDVGTYEPLAPLPMGEVYKAKAKAPRLMLLRKATVVPVVQAWFDRLMAAGGEAAVSSMLSLLPDEDCAAPGASACDVTLQLTAPVTEAESAKKLKLTKKKIQALHDQIVYDVFGDPWRVRVEGKHKIMLFRQGGVARVTEYAHTSMQLRAQPMYAAPIEQRTIAVGVESRAPLKNDMADYGLQPRYLLQALRHAPVDEIELSLVSKNLNPYRVDAGPYPALIMPMRGPNT